MASTEFSLEAANKSLSEEGFFALEDSVVGEGILEMEKRGFEYFSEYGLDFCKQHVLNERIIPIVESFFGDESCVLGHWLRYKAHPGHILCFRRGGPKAGRRTVVVHLLPKESRVRYYGGSHRHELPTTEGKRLLYEVSESALAVVGCQSEEKGFPDGGLVIFDARISFEIKQGYAITFEFATADVVEKWEKMNLPDTPGLAQKVADMESSKIRMNFAFKDTTGSTNA
ncbi:hypothetical protein DL98DRAFT_506210 [Cadophora sp. DSE1049]|nr:hypothetical protein DL98DRAFT_506210 [Cadophora sp. DSE1049]